jgi:hypothetical protein
VSPWKTTSRNMRAAADRINMPETTLIDAVIQGLKLEIRLFVLHSDTSSLQDVLETAKLSEAAHAADVPTSTSLDTVTSKLDLLMNEIKTMKRSQQQTEKIINAVSSEDQVNAIMKSEICAIHVSPRLPLSK